MRTDCWLRPMEKSRARLFRVPSYDNACLSSGFLLLEGSQVVAEFLDALGSLCTIVDSRMSEDREGCGTRTKCQGIS
jgi:hypothetical protein